MAYAWFYTPAAMKVIVKPVFNNLEGCPKSFANVSVSIIFQWKCEYITIFIFARTFLNFKLSNFSVISSKTFSLQLFGPCNIF